MHDIKRTALFFLYVNHQTHSCNACHVSCMFERYNCCSGTARMHSYVCVYIYIYIYIYTYKCICICICIYIHAWMHVYIRTCLYIVKHIYPHKNATHLSQTSACSCLCSSLVHLPFRMSRACVYVCVSMSVYAYMPWRISRACVCMCIYECVCICTYVRERVCNLFCVCMCVFLCVFVCPGGREAFIRACLCSSFWCVPAYMHVCMYVCIYIHI